MIIKSLSRKGRGFTKGKGASGRSPFAALARYMNRGIEQEDGQAVLWHNFYGSEKTREEDLVHEFERNAARLKERANGNVLYHEILSFSRGYRLRDEELARVVADIGQEYLNERAPDQLGYGVIHKETDHIHLHLMISSNQVGKSDRVRLSKKEFAEVQKRIESFAIERYPDMAQTQIYNRARPREKLKTEVHEQAMKARTKEPSRKEQLKARIHQLFERATDFEDLSRLAQAEGIRFYQRGKSPGVTVREADGSERNHRLSTLGVEEHYLATNVRLASEKGRGRPMKPPIPEPEQSLQSPPEKMLTALEREAQELLRVAKMRESGMRTPPSDAPKDKGRDRDDDR